MNNYEDQYLSLMDNILTRGKWVYNKRTGRKCLTLIGEQMKFSGSSKTPPLLTTKQSYPVSAVAEIVGYLRKYTNAQQFADIGSPTWFVNANETKWWLENKARKGLNDIGAVYGAALEDGELEDLFSRIISQDDDRGLTLDFWKPEKFHLGCLRPCMKEHTFSIVEDTISITSNSRSVDSACGLNFNSIQSYFLLHIAAKLSGLKPEQVTHNLTNVHIYDSHIDGIKEQLSRKPLELDTEFRIKGWVEYLEDITCADNHARDYFSLTGYEHLGKIGFDLVA